jgi:hypothetical protein
MLITAARASGDVSTRIDGTTSDIAEVTGLLTNNDIILGGTLTLADPVLGNVYYILDPMTYDESVIVLNGILTMLNARLTTLNATLAAM